MNELNSASISPGIMKGKILALLSLKNRVLNETYRQRQMSLANKKGVFYFTFLLKNFIWQFPPLTAF